MLSVMHHLSSMVDSDSQRDVEMISHQNDPLLLFTLARASVSLL